MKSISIIVPLYNEEDNIKELLDSIFINIKKIENYKFEVIIVDDGSTDNTY